MRRFGVDVPLLKEFPQVEAKSETNLSSRHYLDDYCDFEPFPSHRLRPQGLCVLLSRSLCPVSFLLWPWCWLPFGTKEVFGTSEEASVWFTNEVASGEGTRM